MTNSRQQAHYADKREIEHRALGVAKQLQGLPVSQALGVLRETEQLLLAAHLVDLTSCRC